ncbi:uncharacterized protein LOC116844966, partial [Odontomachus brunneus]|uniref:uncharacterized protein LOC116844966 n=1 Tax=Odontomachus brunneus TaxID=486640 RepID=UPI0013F1956E
MGSSSSTQEKKNISDTRRLVRVDKANLEFNSIRNARYAYEYNHYLHNQVNNPSKVSCKPFNDLPKTATNKPNNDLSKSTTYNPSSSSSIQEKKNISDTRRQVKSDANLEFNSIRTAQCAYEYDHYLHNQVNNPSKVSCKPFNDLPKTAINKPSNDLSKSTTYNPSNDLSKTVSSKLNTGLPELVTNKPSSISSRPPNNNSNDTVAKYNDCERKKCQNCNSYHTFTELGKLSTYCSVLSRVDCKDTIDVQSNFGKDALYTKEEYNLKSKKIDARSKEPTNIPTILSLKTLTKDDFIPMWFSWKNDFLTNMKLIDQAENNKEKWGIMLLNRLGPVGQDIYRTFTFDDSQANDDINVLFEKFDHYCMFGSKKRTHNEDIDIYVNNLKVVASKYMTNVDEIVKKKILEEIDVEKFTNNAKILIPGFSFPSSTMFLTVQEITHIWMKYENVSFKKDEKIVNYTVKNCSKCSLDHAINCCRAYGRQCTKCGNMNHHWSRCPSQYKENCSYCGESHFYRQCPAYMNECSKCRRLNHFYWMCG